MLQLSSQSTFVLTHKNSDTLYDCDVGLETDHLANLYNFSTLVKATPFNKSHFLNVSVSPTNDSRSCDDVLTTQSASVSNEETYKRPICMRLTILQNTGCVQKPSRFVLETRAGPALSN